MLFNIFFIISIYKLSHYVIEKTKLEKNDFTIYPYFYVKNNQKINILFWDSYKEDSWKTLFTIKCKNNIKHIKRTKKAFYLDEHTYSYRYSYKIYNLLKFDTNKIYYKYHLNKKYFKINFKCDLKYLELIYNGSTFTKNTIVSNLQIFDEDNDDINLNFLKPLIFVNLREENINTKIFTNKFDMFHGGFNGSESLQYSKLNSFYDEELGVNWVLNKNKQFIELDDKIFYYLHDKILRSFSLYLNFDIINKFLDKKNIINKNIYFSIYTMNTKNINVVNFFLRIQIYNNKYKVSFSNKNYFTIFSKEIDLYDNTINSNFRQKQINKNDLGIKFFIFRYFNNLDNRYLIGFKKNSNFIRNNNTLFKLKTKSTIYFNSINYQDYSHFIGESQKGINNYVNDNNLLFYFNLNEYGIFSGAEFDEIKNIDNDLFLRIKGKNNILITNNINLDRKYNLYNYKKTSKCSTFKCVLCDINDICLYCYYNYFLDKWNNCIFNNNNYKFINEYSELFNIQEELEDNDFNTNTDQKSKNVNNIDLSNTIIYLNINIQSLNSINYLNFKHENSKFIDYNIFFEYKIKNKPLTIYLKNNDNLLNTKYIYEIKNNNNYKIDIKKNIYKINCNNLENEIFYKEINCNEICNKKKYYYKKINEKKGKCTKIIEDGYYLDNHNILLKCPKNCISCEYIETLKNIFCGKCLKGYKLINGFCQFNNEFNCNENKDLIQIFDNNNFDNIKICNDFCNLCRNKGGIKCSILNLNFDYCNIKNIKITKPSIQLIKKNLEKCDIIKNNNTCIKCKNKYFLNEINICDKCINNCTKCDDSLSCNSCIKGYFLKDKKCINCNSKFKKCLECNNKKCLKFESSFVNFKNADINCNFPYILENNKCRCNLKNNYFIKNKKCLNCSSCLHCIKDSNIQCINCDKCKSKFKFKFKQFKNKINIYYDSNIVNLNKNTLNLKTVNLKFFTINFNPNYIKIEIFDKEIIDGKIIIKNNIIKNLKEGYFNNQTINLKNYNSIKNQKKNINNEIEVKKINIFSKINFNNNLINYGIKVTTESIGYTRFSTILMELIILLNESSLLILLNTKFSNNFWKLLKLIKKKNVAFLKNEYIFPSNKFKKSYNQIKKKFNHNLIIGEVNLIDIDLIIILLLLTIYYILNYVFKNLNTNNNKILNFIKKYKINLKVISFTILQSYLIKYYYKIIFLVEIFFLLEDYLLKIYLFIFIQFYVILIIYFLDKNYYYCKLFINPLLNFKSNNEYKMVRLFVSYKNKKTRNFNLIMNIIDFFIVLIFMKLKSNFFIQILLIMSFLIIKLIYTIFLFPKYKKNKLFTQSISHILLLSFYLLLMIKHYFLFVNDISYLIILFFILINVWEIIRIFIYYLLKAVKFIKNKKLSKLKNIYEKFSIKKYSFRESNNKKFNQF